MNNRTVGAILLIGAGFIAAFATVGAQIANSIVLVSFHLAKMGGNVPASPSEASPHWLVHTSVVMLIASGWYFLFSRNKAD
jgi:hypothetical protein